jgi:deoxyribonuclease IV
MPKIKAIPATRDGRPSAAAIRPEQFVRHRFGAHTSIAGGMHKALEIGLQLGCDVVQVFVKNQRQWRASPLRADDLQQWLALLSTPGFGPAVAHATYLINLASADQVILARSRGALAVELHRCEKLRIPYLVLHPGAATDGNRHAGIRRVAAALDAVIELEPALGVMPLLESTAGQGGALGWQMEELGEIIGRMRQPDRVGVCLDTCHLFAAGYDLRRPRLYDQMVATAERAFGLQRIRCWHLNDSKAALGARVDRHEHIGRGKLGKAGFRNLLADARFRGLPMILETPKGKDATGRDWDALNMRVLAELVARSG